MNVPNVLEKETLNRLTSGYCKRGRVVIESPPDPAEVGNFLTSLKRIPGPPLADRFNFSLRDGTIAVTHRLSNKPEELLALFPDRERVCYIRINLFTQTQDYTWRGKERFDPKFGWRQFVIGENNLPASGENTEVLVRVVTPLFDDLQRHLLTNWPSYLHRIRIDSIDQNGLHELVVTVETARRYRSEPEPNIGRAELNVQKWPYMDDFTRRPAPAREITLWAALSVQDTDPDLDSERLQIIADSIRAENLSRESLTKEPDIVQVHGGNRVALLRVRNAYYRDGRARFAIARAALMDQGVIPRAPKGLEMRDFRLNAPPKSLTLNYEVTNWTTIFKIVFSDLLVSCLGLLYLCRLRSPDADVDAVVGVALAAVASLALPSLPFWFKIFTGRFDATLVLRRNRSVAVKELLQQANGDTRATIEAVTSPAATQYFNGNGLTFSGLQYTGHHDFNGTFSMNELLQAGYETTFTRSGREILIAPGSPPLLSQIRFSSEQKAVFEPIVSNKRKDPHQPSEADLENEVLEFVRGVWPSNVFTGCGQKVSDSLPV